MMRRSNEPTIWLPTILAGTGADVFTQRLCDGLNARGVRAEITWLPLRAEYAPLTVPVPKPPSWANVVHVNTWLHPRFIPGHIRVVATMHHCVHDADFRPYKTLSQAIYHRLHIKPIERAVLHRADEVVAVSQFTAERTRAAFGNLPIRVIPNGVCVDPPFQPLLGQRMAHRPFRLVYVGTGSRRKGFDLLLPIMDQLGDAFELTVIGRNALSPSTVPPNVRLVGRLPTVDALAAAYREADALLFPSRLEGFGLVAAEAMACGLPVIATRGSSLMEVVEDGVTGVLCARDNVVAFAKAVRSLADDPERAQRMSVAAREAAVNRFSESAMLDAYCALYEVLNKCAQ